MVIANGDNDWTEKFWFYPCLQFNNFVIETLEIMKC